MDFECSFIPSFYQHNPLCAMPKTIRDTGNIAEILQDGKLKCKISKDNLSASTRITIDEKQ